MIVTVQLKAKDGKEQEVVDALQKVMPMVEKEEGTLIYTLSQNTEDNSLLMYEAYTGKEAFDSHINQPYIQELLAFLNTVLAEEPVIATFNKIDGIN